MFVRAPGDTPTDTATPSQTGTATASGTATPTSTITPTPSNTGTPTQTPTITLTPTITDTPTITPTPSDTGTATNTTTATSTATAGPPLVRDVATDLNAGTLPNYYAPGHAVAISATVLDSYGNPATNATVSARVSLGTEDGPTVGLVTLSNGGAGDVYRGTLDGANTTAQGVYAVAVQASLPGLGSGLDPGYATFVVSTRTLSFGGQITFPGTVHQGDMASVVGGVFNRAYVPDGATVQLQELDGGGAVLSTLVSQAVSGVAARGTGAFTLSFPTAALAVGTHHLRLHLTDLPPGQDGAASTDLARDMTVAPAVPGMALAPNPLTLGVQAGGTLDATFTVTNPSALGVLQGVALRFDTGGNAQAQLLPWLSLSGTSLADIGPGKGAQVTLTAAPGGDVAPGVYNTYVLVASSNGPSQYLPVSVVVDSGQHGPLQFEVTDTFGQAIAGARVRVVEQIAPYTALETTSDGHGAALVPNASVGVPYRYTVSVGGANAPAVAAARAGTRAAMPRARADAGSDGGYDATSDAVTLDGPGGKFINVALSRTLVRPTFNVVPTTIVNQYTGQQTITYQTNLQETYHLPPPLPTGSTGPGTPTATPDPGQTGPIAEPQLVLAPAALRFDFAHQDRSGTLTILNTGNIGVDRVVVAGPGIANLRFALTYTDASGTQQDTSVTIPHIDAGAVVTLHYVASYHYAQDCPTGSAGTVNPGHAAPVSAPLTASYSFLSTPAEANFFIQGGQNGNVTPTATGTAPAGTAPLDLVLANTGYQVMRNIRLGTRSGGTLAVDLPPPLPAVPTTATATPTGIWFGTIRPGGNTPVEFVVHTDRAADGGTLQAGRTYSTTVTLQADTTPDATLTISAIVVNGLAILSFAFHSELPGPVPTQLQAQSPVTVMACAAAASTLGFEPDPVVVVRNGVASVTTGGLGGAAPFYPGVDPLPPPQVGPHEVVQLQIADTGSLDRPAYTADLQNRQPDHRAAHRSADHAHGVGPLRLRRGTGHRWGRLRRGHDTTGHRHRYQLDADPRPERQRRHLHGLGALLLQVQGAAGGGRHGPSNGGGAPAAAAAGEVHAAKYREGGRAVHPAGRGGQPRRRHRAACAAWQRLADDPQ